jgi:hypothetical protein
MRLPIIICAAAILCGCTTSEKAPPPVFTTAYAGKPLATIVHKAPDFTAVTWTTAKMMGNATGGDSGVSEGNELVKEFAIADPAADIAASLSSGLSAGLNTVPGDAAHPTGLLLDIETTGWAFVYIPEDPIHYEVKYMGRARLIDAATAADIASVPCRWESNAKDAPGYDDLLAGRGALLKDMLASAAKDCAATYRKQILAVPALQQPAVAAQ